MQLGSGAGRGTAEVGNPVKACMVAWMDARDEVQTSATESKVRDKMGIINRSNGHQGPMA